MAHNFQSSLCNCHLLPELHLLPGRHSALQPQRVIHSPHHLPPRTYFLARLQTVSVQPDKSKYLTRNTALNNQISFPKYLKVFIARQNGAKIWKKVGGRWSLSSPSWREGCVMLRSEKCDDNESVCWAWPSAWAWAGLGPSNRGREYKVQRRAPASQPTSQPS